MIKIAIILSLLFVSFVHAQTKKKASEYLSTGASFHSIQRMYDEYNKQSIHRPQDLKYLEFNLYAYNELKKVIEPEEKARLFAFLQTNYFRQSCKEGNARIARKNGGKVKVPDVNCSTYAIKVSEYSKYSPKYNDDTRSKINSPVKIDFEKDTYTIRKETFSLKTGNYVKVNSTKKSNKKRIPAKLDEIEDAVEPAVKQFLPPEQRAVETNQ